MQGLLTKLHLRKKPMTEAEKAAATKNLALLEERTHAWDNTHQIDLDKFAQALTLAAEAHEEKPFVLRSTKYTQAETLARQARGIDDETWSKAKKAIGMQGLADVYDSAATVLLAGPALAAAAGPGAEVLGSAGGKILKYAALWVVTPISNGAGQIMVDGYQDVAVRHQGLPNFMGDLASAPKLRAIYKEVDACLKRCTASPHMQAAIAESKKESPNAELIEEHLAHLEPEAKKLEELHLAYQRRIALGQSNFIKYETQVAYKIATTPGVVTAGVFGGPFALWGAMTVQQALQAPFGYMDEIFLKKHIARSNMKYGEFRTQEAIDAGITPLDPRWGPHCVDPKKVEATWTNPIDVLQTNVSFIYKDKLATLLRELAKMDKHIDELETKLESEYAKGEENHDQGKIRKWEKKLAKMAAEHGKLADEHDQLIADIGHFEAGVATIKLGGPAPLRGLSEATEKLEALQARLADPESGVTQEQVEAAQSEVEAMESGYAANPYHWNSLSPDGTIAQVLLDSKEHFTKLTAAKFRRPGEYTAQVLDRHGGLSLPRTVGAAISDGFKLDDKRLGAEGDELKERPPLAASDFAGGGVYQAGVLAGNAIYNPITKFTKQRYTRKMGLPDPVRYTETGEVERISLLKKNSRPITSGKDRKLQPTVEVPVPGFENKQVDITQTRAFWKASHSAASSMALGTADAVVGLGSHMKAAGTLPYRYTKGAIADHRAKSMTKQLDNLRRASAGDTSVRNTALERQPPEKEDEPAKIASGEKEGKQKVKEPAEEESQDIGTSNTKDFGEIEAEKAAQKTADMAAEKIAEQIKQEAETAVKEAVEKAANAADAAGKQKAKVTTEATKLQTMQEVAEAKQKTADKTAREAEEQEVNLGKEKSVLETMQEAAEETRKAASKAAKEAEEQEVNVGKEKSTLKTMQEAAEETRKAASKIATEAGEQEVNVGKEEAKLKTMQEAADAAAEAAAKVAAEAGEQKEKIAVAQTAQEAAVKAGKEAGGQKAKVGEEEAKLKTMQEAAQTAQEAAAKAAQEAGEQEVKVGKEEARLKTMKEAAKKTQEAAARAGKEANEQKSRVGEEKVKLKTMEEEAEETRKAADELARLKAKKPVKAAEKAKPVTGIEFPEVPTHEPSSASLAASSERKDKGQGKKVAIEES